MQHVFAFLQRNFLNMFSILSVRIKTRWFLFSYQVYTAYINLCHVYKRFSEAMKTLVLFFPRHYGLTKRNLLSLGCLINNL